MMPGTVPKKTRDNLIPVQITEDAYAAVADFCRKRDRIKRDTISKIVLALLRQPEPVRTALMGEVDAGMNEAYAAALVRLADEVRAGQSDPPPRPEDGQNEGLDGISPPVGRQPSDGPKKPHSPKRPDGRTR
jgi:hypothetical protein